jgi:anaerobic magnesium-protoporphyrin IX monomethyl ester cyclase
MKIALVRPPKLMVRGTLTMPPAPPLGMAYVAAALRKAGHEVVVIDAIAMAVERFTDFGLKDIVIQGLGFEEIAAAVPSDAAMIGLSCMFSNNWLLDRKLLDHLAEAFPHAMIIAGGESISAMPEYAIESSRLHVAVVGEGEDTVTDLAEAVESGRSLEEVAGIVFRGQEGPMRNPKRDRISAVDALSIPAWDLFPTDLYFKHQITWIPTPARSLPLLATRGCPYSCTFCSSPQMWTTRYNMRSPQNILDEMVEINKRFGVTNFELFDLTAIINRKWVLDFSKLLQDHPQRFTWQMPAGTRSEALSSEVISEMALSGCTNITFAPESGSPELLKSIRKKADPEAMLPAMRTASKLGLYVYINTIIGLPGERHRDVWKTIWYLMRSATAGADDTGVGVFMPYPGTVLFNELEKQGRVGLNEGFFLNILMIDSFGGSTFYNTQISGRMYRFYNVLILLMFYATSVLFRPGRVVRLCVNVWRKTYTTRSEKTFGYLLEQVFQRADRPRIQEAQMRIASEPSVS